MKINKIPGYKLIFTKKIKKKISSDISKVLSSGNLMSGLNVKKLEDKFKKLHNTKFAIACSSGGSALEIIFRSLNLRNKEIILPSNTFIATYNAVKFSGSIPVLADTKKNSLNTSLDEIKKKVSNKTKAICVVHVGSYICEDIIEIRKYCKRKNFYLIEDCAHSILTKYKNIYSGNFGDAAAFSMVASKSVTSGEGGVIATNNKSLYKKFKLMRSYGMSSKYGNFDYKYFSSNYRMNELEASVGYHHLSNYNLYLKRKKEIEKIYDLNLNKFKKYSNNSKTNLYKYILILKNSQEKKKLKKFLEKNGIFLAGEIYQKPLQKYKIFEKVSSKDLKNSVDICSRHICLPIYYGLSDTKVKYIVKKLNEFKKIEIS